jgi:hypothetical protein
MLQLTTATLEDIDGPESEDKTLSRRPISTWINLGDEVKDDDSAGHTRSRQGYVPE